MKIRLNRREYSKYSPEAASITVRLSDIPTPNVAYYACLRRLDGYGDVIRTLFTPTSASHTITLALESASVGADAYELAPTDAQAINWIKQGDYLVEIRDAAFAPVAASYSFPISIVLVDEFKKDYLFGIPLHAEYQLMPVRQPVTLQGVTVQYIDNGTLKGSSVLRYDPTLDPPTLAWQAPFSDEFGAAVDIEPDTESVILMSAEEDVYIECAIDSFQLEALALAEITDERIIIDNTRISDATLRTILRDATSVIQADLQVSLEPTIITTEPEDTERVPFYEKIAKARDYVRSYSTSMAVALQTTGARPLLRVDRLVGKYADRVAIEIDAQALVLQSQAAMIEVVPTRTSFIRTFGMSSIGIGTSGFVPNFWHWTAVCGFRDLHEDRTKVREAIQKRAAVLALRHVSLALSGGRTNTSTSRDNISSSVSYGQNGVYGEKIGEYEEWLKTEIPLMVRRYRGPIMEIL